MQSTNKGLIKAVLFDVDGVLANGKRFSETLEKDLGVSKEKSLPFFTGKFLDCLVGKADLKEELEPLLDDWNWDGTIDEFLIYWFKSEHAIDEPLIEEVKKLQNKNIQCFVITNQEKYRTAYIINEMGFGNIFDGIFSSADVGYMKPQHEFFLNVLNKIGFQAKEVLFVDDTVGHIESAKVLGIQTILFTNTNEVVKKLEKVL